MIILKSAAYYALIDEELEEILSCDNEPVLRAYVAGLFRAACRLWKFVMPVEARAVFQNDVFHPATVVPNLQAHLGLSLEKRIFDKYVGFVFEYVIYNIYNIFCIFSWVGKGYKYFCPQQLPKAKEKVTSKREAEGAMTGDDYDLMLHCTNGHLRRVDGALPDFDDGEKALNLLAPPGAPRYIFCIFCIFCIFFICLCCADTLCARRSLSMDFGTIS